MKIYNEKFELSNPSKLAKINRLKALFPSTNKNKKAGAKTTVSRALAMELARKSQALSPKKFANYITRKILPGIPLKGWTDVKDENGKKTGQFKIVDSAWYVALKALAAHCRNVDNITAENAPYELFAKNGNKKLNFYAWSTLPVITCPGAGACAQWCYSFKAWRYPSALCRQIFNTMLLKLRPDVIKQAFLAIPTGKTIRLYVDGDIDSQERLSFWMGLCMARPDIDIYGYSKSWKLFIDYAAEGGVFADNYVINLSSGSKYGAQFAEKLAHLVTENGLPLVRGIFAAVKIDMTGITKGEKRYENPLYHQRVRDAIQRDYGKKGYSCGGNCNEGGCKIKQQCGNRKAQGLIIAIGIH